MKYLTIGLLLVAMLLVFGCSEKKVDENAADTSKGSTGAEPAVEEVEEVSTGVEEVDDLMTELDTTEIEDPGIDDTTFQ